MNRPCVIGPDGVGGCHRHRLARWVEQGNWVAYEVTGTGSFHRRPADPGGESADVTIAHFTAGAIAEVRDGKLAYEAFYFDQMAILCRHGQPWVDRIRTRCGSHN